VFFEITLKNYRCFSDEKPAKFQLRPGFTALVGPNNSGKSSLLRFAYEFRPLLRQVFEHPWLHQAINSTVGGVQVASSVLDFQELFNNNNARDISIEIRLLDPETTTGALNPAESITLSIRRDKTCSAIVARRGGAPLLSQNGLSVDPTSWRVLEGNVPVADLAAFRNFFATVANSIYIGPFRNAINVGSNESYFDIRTGQAFVRRWRDLKLGQGKLENQAAVRLTEDIQRIFEFKKLEIAPAADDSTLQVYVDGRPYHLSELGAGLTQFIIVLTNVALGKPSYVLIDEPELGLHPSLQLDFLTTLGSYATEGVLFATHSVGLARSSADRIYSTRKLEDGSVEVSDFAGTSRLSEFLGALSYSSYHALGYDTVILVEGPTELRAIQQLLRLYRKDHRTVILPLSGSSSINASADSQLEEVRRISTRVLALIDSERSSVGEPLSTGRQAFVDSCGKLKIECKILDRRALENYFTQEALQRAFGPQANALGPYDQFKWASGKWSKSENWRAAREMTREDLLRTDLGEFLERV
jgi:ABC-type cobalamin/Fe3+-siderophores transport system ATPase subunit